MSKISLQLVNLEHAEEILEFEKKNREFFASIVPDRGDDYYTFANIHQTLLEVEKERQEDLCYMFLVRNAEQELVGRVNLFGVVRGLLNKAELGYRIAEEHNGKGYGTKAVELAIHEAFNTFKFHRLDASTSPENIGSQIVLIKNKFQFTGRTPQYINVNGTWSDSIHFSIINQTFN
ncbi:GNAT family protein [Bacillus tianshenii]|nr:GNAT family protein [Bacillus tianshenii]